MIQPSDIYALVACEESQVVTTALRDLGVHAISCDLQKPRRGGVAEWHICQDTTPLLQGETKFCTYDGAEHSIPRWTLIIAHPPSTYICKAGSPWMHKNADHITMVNGKELSLNYERYVQMKKAVKFFKICLNAKAPYVAVDNPLPQAIANLPSPTTYIQPFWFGEPYSKKTLLWLKNLPPLMPTVENPVRKCFVTNSRGKYRSRTLEGVARAMASQWTAYILDELNKGIYRI